ncbi:MAG: DNA-binding transcriptional regulator [Phycisphaerae bacterium]|nr:DNA-binding transcriptional regulator [Phycisphaerae bacterium]
MDQNETRKVILFVDMSRAYGRGLIKGFVKYSQMHGPWRIYHQFPSYSNKSVKEYDIEKFDIDGVFIADIYADVQNVQAIKDSGKVIIVKGVDQIIEGIPNVVSENEAIGRLAAEHFISKGFKNFAYCGFSGIKWSKMRGASFQNHLEAKGFSVAKIEFPEEALAVAQEENNIAQWIMDLPKPVAILASNDERGRQIVDICDKLTPYNVPSDIAVLGVDDDELVCEMTNPPLSSISRNFEKGGYEAAETMDRIFKGEKLDNAVMTVEPIQVVSRQSTDVVAVEDNVIAAAITFISRSYRQVISVEDVAKEVAVSRRSLERKFKSNIGRTVLEEIHRHKNEQVVKYLTETNMTIAQIARLLGFANPKSMGRAFKKERGISPQQCRYRFSKI